MSLVLRAALVASPSHQRAVECASVTGVSSFGVRCNGMQATRALPCDATWSFVRAASRNEKTTLRVDVRVRAALSRADPEEKLVERPGRVRRSVGACAVPAAEHLYCADASVSLPAGASSARLRFAVEIPSFDVAESVEFVDRTRLTDRVAT